MSDQPQQHLSDESYRVVTDQYAGFRVQVRSPKWWGWSRWRMLDTNTHSSLEDAIAYARKDARKKGVVVADLGRIPIGTGPLTEVTSAQRAA